MQEIGWNLWYHLHGVGLRNFLNNVDLARAIVWEVGELTFWESAVVVDDFLYRLVVELLNQCVVFSTIPVPVMEDIVRITHAPLLLILCKLIIVNILNAFEVLHIVVDRIHVSSSCANHAPLSIGRETHINAARAWYGR